MRTFALLRHNLPSYSASVKTSLSFVERPLTSCLRTTFSRARTGLFTRNFHPPFRIRIQSPSCKSFTSLCDWATRSLTWSYTATHRSNQRNVPWWHFLGFYKAASLITNQDSAQALHLCFLFRNGPDRAFKGDYSSTLTLGVLLCTGLLESPTNNSMRITGYPL